MVVHGSQCYLPCPHKKFTLLKYGMSIEIGDHQTNKQTNKTPNDIHIHYKLLSITPMATKVHVILHSFVVLTWMRDTTKLV